MTLLNIGLNTIRDIHAATIDKCQLGTSSTAVALTQTALVAAEADTKLTPTVTKLDRTTVVSYTLPSTVGTGDTYREFATMDDGVALYTRDVFTGIAHDDTSDLIVRTTFFYRRPGE